VQTLMMSCLFMIFSNKMGRTEKAQERFAAGLKREQRDENRLKKIWREDKSVLNSFIELINSPQYPLSPSVSELTCNSSNASLNRLDDAPSGDASSAPNIS